MIRQSSLDDLKARCELTEIMGRYTTVKKDFACCPIHQEKTPSLKIYSNKQIFKCFGCGESGDAIKLVMEMERLNFTEAAEWLAQHYNITLEYDQALQQETQETKDKRTEMLAVAEWTNKKYTEALRKLPADSTAIQYLQGRGFDEERIKAWDLGFAPDDRKFITTPLIN